MCIISEAFYLRLNIYKNGGKYEKGKEKCFLRSDVFCFLLIIALSIVEIILVKSNFDESTTTKNQDYIVYAFLIYLGFQLVSTIIFLVQKHRHDLIILEGYSYRSKAEKYTATCYGPNDTVTTHEYISPHSEKESSMFQTNIAIFIVSVCMPIIPLIGLLLYLLVQIIGDLKK